LINNEDYFADDNSGSCGTRQKVVVTINSTPRPTGNSFQGPCVESLNDATLQDFDVTGSNIKWYSNSSGGSPLLLTTIIVNGTTYYASQTDPVTGCESLRKAVQAKIGLVPTPTGDPTQDFCNDPNNIPTVGSLVASGSNNWYESNGSSTPLDLTTPLVNGEDYYATTVDPPCESITRFRVDVTLVKPNDAGTNGSRSICVSDLATTLPFDLYKLLGGSPDKTGTWSGPLSTINGYQGTVNVSSLSLVGSPYTFTYTVSSATCAPATSTVVITVLPLPTVSISSNLTLCSGSNGTVTFTGTPNATVTYTVNGGSNQTIVLNASGTATINRTFSSTTTYSLVSVASSGIPSCSQVQSGSATITVLPLPTVTISTNSTICSGSSATVTFTGTPNATVTYTVNGGNNQTIVLNALGTATVTNTYNATTTFALVSIASATAPVCTQPQSGTVVITVIPQPTVTISASQSICPNGSATVTFTGTPNATVTYTVNGGGNQTIVLNASGTASIINTYSVNTTFSLVSIATGTTPVCSRPQSGTSTITILPLPSVVISSNSTICSGSSATVNFTGTPNATVTYKINGGNNQTIVLNASGSASLVNTYNSTTTISLVSIASSGTPSCSQPQLGTVTITVIPLPIVTLSNNVNVCPNGSATVTFTGTPNATVTYNVNGGSNQTIVLNSSGTATITNTYSTTTTYNLVSITSATTPACPQPQTGSVIVTVIPLPTVVISGNVTVCPNGSATVTFTGTPNATVTYTVNGGANQTILLNASGTATVANTYTTTTIFSLVSVSTSGNPSCSQTQTGSVTVTVKNLPVVSIAANTDICVGGSATVTFTGTPNATVTYTVNGGVNQTIILNNAGVATITNTYSSTTVFALVSVASNGTPNCSQPQTGTATITVVPLPTVTLSSNTTVCSGSSATVTFTGTPNAIVTYKINNGSNQTIVLNNSGTATLTNTYSSTTLFTLVSIATSGSPGCVVPQSGSITITVKPLPTVTISADTTICSGSSATVTFTGTPNATVTYNINGGASQTIVLNNSGTATITNTYSVNTTYNLVSITSSGVPACPQPQSGKMTITVSPLPFVTISSNATICSGSSATVTFTGTPNATVTYTVNEGDNETIVLNSSGTATITDTYTKSSDFALVSVSLGGSSGCSQPQQGQVSIEVVPLPVVSITSSETTVCSGSSATVTFEGTPDAIVTYSVNGGSNQTIVLDDSGIASITATYSVTTVYVLVDVTLAGLSNCGQPQTETITINVEPLPVVTISSNTTICIGSSATVTFTGTPNATVTYTVNGGANQTIVLDNLGTASIVDTYSVNTTYSLVSVASLSTPVCNQPQAGTMTITVSPPPTVTISSSQTICSGQSATITFTGTPNATVTYLVDEEDTGTIVLDASGLATITDTYTKGSTYTLVSVTSAGSSGCTLPVTGEVAIDVVPLPVVSIESDATTICSGLSATVTFIGTPDTIVTYTINGGNNQTITLDDSGSASIVNTYVATTTFTLVSAALSGNSSCSQPQSGDITINVEPLPTVTIGVNQTICSGDNASITFTGTPNATVTYTVNGGSNQTIILDNLGSAILSNAYTSTTVISLVDIATIGSPGCSNPQTGTITITVLPLPTATITADTNVCLGSSATITISGTPNATVVYKVNNGNEETIVLDTNGTAIINSTITATTVYDLVSVKDSGVPSCSKPLTESVTIAVNPLPTATVSSSPTVCSGTNTTVTFTGTPNSIVTYTINGGNNQTIAIGASGSAVLNTSLNVTSTYMLLSVTLANPPSCTQSLSASTTSTVTQPPVAGSNASLSICSESTPQDLFLLLGSNAQPGGTWSPTLASGTGVFNPLLDSAGSYVYTVAGTPPCVNDTALVTVTITPAANAGTNTQVDLCSNADSVDLVTLLGGTPQSGGTWSPALTSGIGIFDPSKDSAGIYTYTVGGTAPCLNVSATVTITITPGLNAGNSGTATFCLDSAPKDLFLSLGGTPQVGGTWSPPLASGTGVFNPAIDQSGLYTYAFSGTEPCSNDTATVTVTVNPLPDAGENASASICSNVDFKDLFTFLGGTPQVGGTWSPALASGTGIFNPAVDKAGVYTYTVGNPFCNPDSADVTVTIVPGPDAGLSGNVTFCATNAPQDLFLSLGGTPQVGGTWTPTLASGTGVFNPAIDIAGVYTYTFEGNQPCDDDTATVTVKVDPIANAGTFIGIQNVCNSIGNFDLFSSLSGHQIGGVWTDSNNQTVSSPVDVSKLSPNTYTYTYTITNSCGSDSETVQFTILTNPVLAAANIAISSSNCKGNNVTVTLSNMVDGSYTINYNLSLANVLANQNANVNIVNGSGTFTINATDVPNIGTTRVTFLSITNITTTCITLINPNVSADFILKPSPNLETKNIVIDDICIGSPLKVVISGATAGLVDGNYQFAYSIPNATPTIGNSGTVAIADGSGQFTVPASYFTNAGDYNFTITSISNLTSGCNNLSEDASAAFQVFPIPDVSGATINAASACLNFSNEVFITGAINLSDGIYTINYQLSGANSSTSSSSVTFVNGRGSFIIPATDLNTSGNVTITVTQLTSNVSQCGASASAINPFTFVVTELETPEIVTKGNEFCDADNPTIADLSANVTTPGTIVWYDVPTGGQALNDTDLLEDGNTYYGAVRSTSGCESIIRLEVIVDLNKCDDVLIPDGFSPNGDKINDEFVIKNIENKYPNYRLEIYNRYGAILYKGNRNTPNWDGTTTQGGIKFGDSKVPVGVYFYILEFNDGTTKPKQGRLYLSR
jgi:mucin-2